MTEYIWMEVTKDKYELPVCIASSGYELARRTGTTANSIYSGIKHARDRGTRPRYVKVPLPEEE